MASGPPGISSDSGPVSADQVGALLVSLLALGMVTAPAVSWLLGIEVHGTAIMVRALVASAAVLLAWVPFPVPGAWRRMVAVSLLAAHHVGMGVAVGMPMALLAELLVGAVFIGGLACWLLPRRGFGALLGLTLAMGTVALGLLTPGTEAAVVGVWAGVFIVGGAAAELSVWVGPRVRPPGALPEPAGETITERVLGGPAMALAEEVGLGVATVRRGRSGLSGASRALLEMTADWVSPTDWWRQVVDRGRVPSPGAGAAVIEMFTPGMTRRRAYRLWAVDEGTGRRIYVQDISAATDARRDTERLARSLEVARGEAESARDARVEAFRARSHNLRTPLSNLMASLELAVMSADEGASIGVVKEDIEAAQTSASELHSELNRLVEDIVSDSQNAASDDVVDLVGLVDSELDALQAARSVRRSYAEAALPVRGTRGEVSSLVQAVVRRAVVATRGTVMVRVEPFGDGETRVAFRVSSRDADLIWAAIRELAPRATVLGGRVEMGQTDGPALVLPQNGGGHRGVEAEVTWPGEIPPVEAPEAPQLDFGSIDHTDDDPTHIAYARRQVLVAQDNAGDGSGASR